jgi:hypothetical protein
LAVLDPVHGAVGVNPLRKVAEASVYQNTTLYMNNKRYSKEASPGTGTYYLMHPSPTGT